LILEPLVSLILHGYFAHLPFEEPHLQGAIINILFWQNHVHKQFAMGAAIQNDGVLQIANGVFGDDFSEKPGLDHLSKIRLVENGYIFYRQTFGLRNAGFLNFSSRFDNGDSLNSEIGLIGIYWLVPGR